MPQTILSPDQDVIVSEIDIAAPPERVFKAITDPEEVMRRAPELDFFEMDTRVGGRWSFEMNCEQKPYHGFRRIRHEGEILEIDPPRLLVYTWFANFHKDPKMRTIVRWELTRASSGTHVKLTHSGLSAEPTVAKDYAGGWAGFLEELKKFVEPEAEKGSAR
jgi:uncharacterized protein YndB with AHSA1/START domain